MIHMFVLVQIVAPLMSAPEHPRCVERWSPRRTCPERDRGSSADIRASASRAEAKGGEEDRRGAGLWELGSGWSTTLPEAGGLSEDLDTPPFTTVATLVLF